MSRKTQAHKAYREAVKLVRLAAVTDHVKEHHPTAERIGETSCRCCGNPLAIFVAYATEEEHAAAVVPESALHGPDCTCAATRGRRWYVLAVQETECRAYWYPDRESALIFARKMILRPIRSGEDLGARVLPENEGARS